MFYGKEEYGEEEEVKCYYNRKFYLKHGRFSQVNQLGDSRLSLFQIFYTQRLMKRERGRYTGHMTSKFI